MKMITGAILILAAAVVAAPGIEDGGGGFVRAMFFGLPLAAVGIMFLAWGVIKERNKD